MPKTEKESVALPDDAAFASPQLSLFQSFLCNTDHERDRLSNTIELWDSIPKYAVSQQAMNKMRTKEGYLPRLEKEFTYRDRLYTIRISPALIDTGKGGEKAFYPKYNHESFDECWYTGGMRPIQLPPMTPTQREQLDRLYRTTKVPRLRTRAQMILLAAEQGLKVPQIALIVRESEATVLRWLKRYLAEGMEGLQDAPRPGRPSPMTEAYKAELLAVVRRRPRSLALPFSLWTLQRLVDYLAEQTGIRVSDETVRRALKHTGIVLSRPQHKISSPDPAYAVKKRRLKTPAPS